MTIKEGSPQPEHSVQLGEFFSVAPKVIPSEKAYLFSTDQLILDYLSVEIEGIGRATLEFYHTLNLQEIWGDAKDEEIKTPAGRVEWTFVSDNNRPRPGVTQKSAVEIKITVDSESVLPRDWNDLTDSPNKSIACELVFGDQRFTTIWDDDSKWEGGEAAFENRWRDQEGHKCSLFFPANPAVLRQIKFAIKEIDASLERPNGSTTDSPVH